MKVIGYVRVSTDEQAEQGHSLAAQRAKIEAYCSLHDHVLVGVECDEGLSGATMERPALKRALATLKRGDAKGLVVVALSRLSRSVPQLAALVESTFRTGKRALYSVTESIDTSSAMGRGVINILSSINSLERDQVAERTSIAMQHMKAQSLYTGGRCRYGYRVGADGTLVLDAAEQSVITEARTLRAAGMAMRAVVASLAERGVVGRTGKPLALPQVARILAA